MLHTHRPIHLNLVAVADESKLYQSLFKVRFGLSWKN